MLLSRLTLTAVASTNSSTASLPTDSFLPTDCFLAACKTGSATVMRISAERLEKQQGDGETIKQSDSQTVSETVRQGDGETIKQSDSQTVRQGDGETVRETVRQSDNQTLRH